MGLFVGGFEIESGASKIDLCDAQIGMAEHPLHGRNVGAVFYELGCKAVAEGVGGDLLFTPEALALALIMSETDCLLSGFP